MPTEARKDSATETTSGAVSFADVDLTDSHTLSATFVSSTNAGGTQLGSMTASKTAYSFESCADRRDLHSFPTRRSSDLFLAAGQTVQETYQVKVDDGHGGTVAQNVVVT